MTAERRLVLETIEFAESRGLYYDIKKGPYNPIINSQNPDGRADPTLRKLEITLAEDSGGPIIPKSPRKTLFTIEFILTKKGEIGYLKDSRYTEKEKQIYSDFLKTLNLEDD